MGVPPEAEPAPGASAAQRADPRRLHPAASPTGTLEQAQLHSPATGSARTPGLRGLAREGGAGGVVQQAPQAPWSRRVWGAVVSASGVPRTGGCCPQNVESRQRRDPPASWVTQAPQCPSCPPARWGGPALPSPISTAGAWSAASGTLSGSGPNGPGWLSPVTLLGQGRGGQRPGTWKGAPSRAPTRAGLVLPRAAAPLDAEPTE